MTTELLGFASSGVSDKEALVVLNQELFHLSLGGLVVVLLVECDESL